MIVSRGCGNAILYSFFRTAIGTLAKTEILAAKMRSRERGFHHPIFGGTFRRVCNKDWEIKLDSSEHVQKEWDSYGWLTVALSFNRCQNFFLSVNWHDPNNGDMNRIRTQNVTFVCSLWSKYSIEGTSLPVLSDVKNSIPKNFYCTKRFAVKFQSPWTYQPSLSPHLVGVIADFDPYVSLLTNKSASVKMVQKNQKLNTSKIYFISNHKNCISS